MLTFTFASFKGGVGKSTLARQFSVLAGVEQTSLLIDRDEPQLTTAQWCERRQAKHPTLDTPTLLTFKGETLTSAVGKLKPAKGMIFIDTRPAVGEPEAEAARVADLVVVPIGTSSDDIKALPETLKMIRRVKQRAVIIVNGAKNEARARDARAALSQYPFPVCPYHLTHRTSIQDAHYEGLGITEVKKKDADAIAEMQKVWAWVQEASHD